MDNMFNNSTKPKHVRMIVAGGRSFSNYEALANSIEAYLRDSNIVYGQLEIVSGGCAGVDLLGERFANERGIAITRFPAQWKKYGRAAGIIRNQEMIDYTADGTSRGILIAFWDGKSKGTGYTVKHSEKAGIEVKIFLYNSNGELLPKDAMSAELNA